MITGRPGKLAQLHSCCLFYEALRASGIRKAELARRMGISRTNVDRLFDLNRSSRIEQLEAAYRALGKRLVIHVEDAA